LAKRPCLGLTDRSRRGGFCRLPADFSAEGDIGYSFAMAFFSQRGCLKKINRTADRFPSKFHDLRFGRLLKEIRRQSTRFSLKVDPRKHNRQRDGSDNMAVVGVSGLFFAILSCRADRQAG
jgi:hypothetical protein